MRPLKLEKITNEGESLRKIYLVSFLRPKFVERSLVITIDDANRPLKIYFSSNDFGTTEWNDGQGLGESHSWQNENAARTSSRRGFAAALSEGKVSEDFALDRIVPDVLNALMDVKLRDLVYRTVRLEKSREMIRPEQSDFEIFDSVRAEDTGITRTDVQAPRPGLLKRLLSYILGAK